MGLWSRNTYYSDYCHKPSCVYRLFDAEDNLLYLDWFPDRERAKFEERSAIHHENPIYNLVRPKMECC